MAQTESEFPDGLRVLAVDDNPVCLKLIVALLQKCRHKVTATTKATEALEILLRNPDDIDIVITDVRMDDMDGFALLEKIGLEMDLPVIMVSGSIDEETVMKGVMRGACDFLVKPVRMAELRNIWQHVYRKRPWPHKSQNEAPSQPNLTNTSSGKRTVLELDEADQVEHKGEEESEANGELRASGSQKKKPRVRWDVELHAKFVEAINRLGGGERATPNEILKEMNVPGLTRGSVSGHLQRYRNGLKKQKEGVGSGGCGESSRSSGGAYSGSNRSNGSGGGGGGVDGYGVGLGIGVGVGGFDIDPGVGVGIDGCNIGVGIVGVGSGVGHCSVTRGPGSSSSIVLPPANFGMNTPSSSFNGTSFAALEDAPFGTDLRYFVHSIMMG
ncbi:hypothetical protein Ancab_024582 [Ancistrocladus abbreviatus]